VLSAADIYGAIARKVAAAGGAAWDRRVGTSKWEKIGFIVRSWSRAKRRTRLYADVPRDPTLWTRPR
jgi:phytoene synthase